MKPILCMDFDGVIHSYLTPWKDVDIIPDLPVPGAFVWIELAQELFDIHIYSRRSIEKRGIDAMRDWMKWHGMSSQVINHLTFAHEKPAAFLTIDDRAICFEGDWLSLDPKELRNFKPWNRRL